MGAQVDTIELGIGHSYVIKDEGAIVVDGGDTNKAKEFVEGMKKTGWKKGLNPSRLG